MKKFFSIIFAALAVSASAKDITIGEIVKIDDINYKIISLDPAQAEVTKSPYAEGELSILSDFTHYGVKVTVTKIGAEAFSCAPSDENPYITGNLIIPEGITEIGWQAFIGCNRLDSISLPSTLESIGNSAFYCFSDKPSTLAGISCAAVMPPACGEMIFGSRFNAKDGVSRDITLWVPKGTVFTYRAERQWDFFNIITDGEVRSIVEETQSIDNVEGNAELDLTAPMFNTLGQPVDADFRGVVIQNGNKFIR